MGPQKPAVPHTRPLAGLRGTSVTEDCCPEKAMAGLERIIWQTLWVGA